MHHGHGFGIRLRRGLLWRG